MYRYNSNWPYRNKSTGQTTTTQALALGLGSMFNHSRTNQNVVWERDVDNQVVRYTALCDIASGQELCEPSNPHLIPSNGLTIYPFPKV